MILIFFPSISLDGDIQEVLASSFVGCIKYLKNYKKQVL